MKTMTLNYYQDPGHGWVKIPIKTLDKLGIADKISHYSYMRDKFAYLEEDCDLGLLFKTCDALGITIKLREFNSNKSSKIRNYDSYMLDNYTVNTFIKEHFQFIHVGG